jgi:hypothetical protein
MTRRDADPTMLVPRVLCATLLLGAIGCGASQAQLDEAKSFVQEGLEVWKKGGKPADLAALAKPIEFHDGVWSAGATLLNYEMGQATYHRGEKVIRCEARVTVRERTGRQKTETVVYDVKLESPVKVINNPMP